jgi:hypothetical protein
MGLLFRHLLIPSNNLYKTTGKYKAGTLRDLERPVNSKTPNSEKIMETAHNLATILDLEETGRIRGFSTDSAEFLKILRNIEKKCNKSSNICT